MQQQQQQQQQQQRGLHQHEHQHQYGLESQNQWQQQQQQQQRESQQGHFQPQGLFQVHEGSHLQLPQLAQPLPSHIPLQEAGLQRTIDLMMPRGAGYGSVSSSGSSIANPVTIPSGFSQGGGVAGPSGLETKMIHPNSPLQDASSGPHRTNKNPLTTSRDDAKGKASSPSAKQKRPQSCDTCRSRKIKCVRLNDESIETSGEQKCVQCKAINAECTYQYVRKRPGPQSSFAKSAKKENQHATQQAGAQPHKSHQDRVSDKVKRVRGTSGSSGTLDGANSITPNVSTSESTPVYGQGWNGALDSLAVFDVGFGVPLQQQQQHQRSHSAQSQSFGGPSSSPMEAPTGVASQYQAASLVGPSTHFPDLGVGPSSSSPFEQKDYQFDLLQQPPSRLAPLQQSYITGNQDLVQSQTSQRPPQYLQPQQPHVSQPQSILFTSTSERVPLSGSTGTLMQQQRHEQDKLQIRQRQTSTSLGRSEAQRKVKQRTPRLQKLFAAPIESPRSLDDVAPIQTFLSVIAIYFQHLYPLMPLVHRPTFAYDLLNRRDEKDQAFLAFVLSLTSYTLVQAPRSVVPEPINFYRKLHRICHLTSRRMQPRTYDPPLLIHLCTLYCDHIYLGSTQKNNAANAVLGEAIRTAFTVGITDERYCGEGNPTFDNGLPRPSGARPHSLPADAIEQELRRRVYFLIYGSDKTIAVLQDHPTSLRDDDTFGMQVPRAVDDDLLTPEGAKEQPVAERGPSVLCGFETISRLYLLLSELLETLRGDRKRPPLDSSTLERRYQYIGEMRQRINAVLNRMPKCLKSPDQLVQSPTSHRTSSDALPEVGAHRPRSNDEHIAPDTHDEILAPAQTVFPYSPWPNGTFKDDGLPNPDGISQGSIESARASPSAREGTKPGSRTSSLYEVSAPPSIDLSNASEDAATSCRSSPWSNQGKPLLSIKQDSDLNLNQMWQPQQRRLRQRPSIAQLQEAMRRLNAFKPKPPPGQAPILTPWATMRANILITETMIRFVLAEYRELLESATKQKQLSSAPSESNMGTLEWEAATEDMVTSLQSISLENLAANGQSMISKMFHLSSALIKRFPAGTRGHAFFCDLMMMFTRLMENRMGDEQDDSSGEDESDEDAEGEEMVLEDDDNVADNEKKRDVPAGANEVPSHL